jgi:hypothetical protein
VSWEPKNFDLAKDTPPKYYILKDTDKWGFRKMEYKCSQGNLILSLDSKSNLMTYCEYKKIGNDVMMVAKLNEKFLLQLGSKPLSELVENDTPVVDWNKISIAKQVDSHYAENIRKHKLYGKLNTDNPLCIFCQSIIDAKKEYKKFEPLSREMVVCYKKYPLTYPSNTIKLLYLSTGVWQLGIECAMKTALEIQNQTKQ